MKKLDHINLNDDLIVMTVNTKTLVPVILSKELCRFIFDTDDVNEVSQILKATVKSKAFKKFVADENDGIGFQL